MIDRKMEINLQHRCSVIDSSIWNLFGYTLSFCECGFFISNHLYFSADLSPREVAKRKTNAFRSFFSWPFLTALEQRPGRNKKKLIDQLFRGYEEELVHNVDVVAKEVHHAQIWIQKIQVQWSEYSLEENGHDFVDISEAFSPKNFVP